MTSNEQKLLELGTAAVVKGVEMGAQVAAEEAAAEDQGTPWHSGVARLTRSSIALVVGVAVSGTIVMNVLGKIDGATAINAVLVLVGMLAGKTALEDSAEKIGTRMHADRAASFGKSIAQAAGMLPELLANMNKADSAIANARAGGLGDNVVPIKPPDKSS